MQLSVVIITFNEEANIARTLASVQPLVADGKGEIIVVDSGSTDQTVEIAKSYGAKVFVEEWKGFAAQKNSAIDKATGDWVLSLDADEEVEGNLISMIDHVLRGLRSRREAESLEAMARPVPELQASQAKTVGYWIQRKNLFLNRWMRHGGYSPDPKLRLFRRG